MSLWIIRILFLSLCTAGGLAVSQVRPEWLSHPLQATIVGFGFGWLMIAIDEMLKGFSLRAFSATTFGLLLGTVVALLIDHSRLLGEPDDPTPLRQIVRMSLFVGFGYIGMVLAMRSNKEDFSLIIPYIRFAPQNKPDNILLLDTSVIIDGRIADLIEANFLEGLIVVPGFVLKLNRIQRNTRNEVRIHDGDFPDEKEVDAKLIRLARNLGAKLYTNDYNLGKVAELHRINCVNLHDIAKSLRSVLLPGEMLSLRIAREGKDKGQGVGYLPDGTMVVVTNGQSAIGQQVEVQVQSLLQTGAGVIVFAEIKQPG